LDYKNNIHIKLLKILEESNSNDKINLFNKFYTKYKEKNIDLSYNYEVL